MRQPSSAHGQRSPRPRRRPRRGRQRREAVPTQEDDGDEVANAPSVVSTPSTPVRLNFKVADAPRRRPRCRRRRPGPRPRGQDRAFAQRGVPDPHCRGPRLEQQNTTAASQGGQRIPIGGERSTNRS
ncbi:unnamed protein product [Prorocentrum cordatum]|uniref:Uncharacterized protein n=1 Tax=Prorocentrum cordatum TaxID=2364126 RepID=A0ABN9UJF4_9DINO|nr:unnamed protein product [Polarella glacialis]